MYTQCHTCVLTAYDNICLFLFAFLTTEIVLFLVEYGVLNHLKKDVLVIFTSQSDPALVETFLHTII